MPQEYPFVHSSLVHHCKAVNSRATVMCPSEKPRGGSLSALKALVIYTACLTSSVVIAQDHCNTVCESIRGQLSSTDACAKARKILPRPKIGRICQVETRGNKCCIGVAKQWKFEIASNTVCHGFVIASHVRCTVRYKWC